MNDYVLNKKPEPAANEIVWAFDLGNVSRPSDGSGWRAATGEGGNWPDEVNKNLHHEFGASLLIPAAFAETKTAALVAHTQLMQTLRHADQRHL